MTCLTPAGIDRTRILRADVVVTDHDQKPAFDRVWASRMPDGEGPVRSFVGSVSASNSSARQNGNIHDFYYEDGDVESDDPSDDGD